MAIELIRKVASATTGGEFGTGGSVPGKRVFDISGDNTSLAAATDKTFTIAGVGNEGVQLIGRSASGASNRPLSITAMGPDANSGGDMIFDVRDLTNAAFSTTANDAFRWRHAAGTIGAVTRGGQWSIGPASNSNTAAPFHVINGSLRSGGSTGDSQRNFALAANAAYPSSAFRDTTTTGGSLVIQNRTSNSLPVFEFLANATGSNANTTVGSVDALGQWIIPNNLKSVVFRGGTGINNGNAIAAAYGRCGYLVIISSNFSSGDSVRSAVYHVLTNNEGTAIAGVASNPQAISNLNSQAVTFSISGGFLVVNGLSAGNNTVTVIANS